MHGYNATPSTSGGFDPVHTGQAGYVNLSQGLPFYAGRSQIQSIPEFQRNPGLLDDTLVRTIKEGRKNFLKVLYEFAERNGRITRPDVKWRWKINIIPHSRFYISEGTYTGTSSISTIKLTNSGPGSTKIKTTNPKGNQNQVGDVSRLQAGDFVLLMFSWLTPARDAKPAYVKGYATPTPEIGKILSVDYAAGTIKVERNWAGSRRVATPTAPDSFTVIADSATVDTNVKVHAKDAFFIRLPRAMKEDDIDTKVYSYTKTWGEGMMQRTLKGWGAGYFQEVLNKNLGNGSQLAKNRTDAIEQYYKDIQWAAMYGEQSEGWDPETGEWWGTTDGLLVNIPTSHYTGLVPMDYSLLRSDAAHAFGSFDIPIFNKIMENKVYQDVDHYVFLMGNEMHTMFATMINFMTQQVPEIKSEWTVTGNRFKTSGGLTIDIVPTDVFSLNGLGHVGIMMDPTAFRLVGLENYPTDIVEVANENPLKSNGFIHGVFGFMDLNPDAHWVFSLDSALADKANAYASYTDHILGVPLA